jgi:hypothetical protein
MDSIHTQRDRERESVCLRELLVYLRAPRTHVSIGLPYMTVIDGSAHLGVVGAGACT